MNALLATNLLVVSLGIILLGIGHWQERVWVYTTGAVLYIMSLVGFVTVIPT